VGGVYPSKELALPECELKSVETQRTSVRRKGFAAATTRNIVAINGSVSLAAWCAWIEEKRRKVV